MPATANSIVASLEPNPTRSMPLIMPLHDPAHVDGFATDGDMKTTTPVDGVNVSANVGCFNGGSKPVNKDLHQFGGVDRGISGAQARGGSATTTGLRPSRGGSHHCSRMGCCQGSKDW